MAGQYYLSADPKPGLLGMIVGFIGKGRQVGAQLKGNVTWHTPLELEGYP